MKFYERDIITKPSVIQCKSNMTDVIDHWIDLRSNILKKLKL